MCKPETKMLLLVYLALSANLILATAQNWTFPDGFSIGVATSAFQIEGGWNEDGKGVNIWDEITRTQPDYIDDQSVGDISCDSYHKWEEDVMLIQNLGVEVYRFSLSWTRLFPDGFTTNLNQPGVDYYNKLIDKLLEVGIEPIVTIFHWDLPQMFAPLGGWSNPALVDYFADYARAVFELFGDRVKTWITFNEPRLICEEFKGLAGPRPPVFPQGVIEYLCAHNVLKAHAEAYHIYDREFRLKQKGRISLTIDIVWYEPATNTPENIALAEQRTQLDFGIYANPILNFDYPEVVKERLAYRSKLENYPTSRLPKFTLEEKLRIQGTYDFLGINHYVYYLVETTDEPPLGQPSLDKDGGGYRFMDASWRNSSAFWIKHTPWALKNLLVWIKKTYRNPEIIITESGFADTGSLVDDDRIEYLSSYMKATLQAVHEDKVNVTSYMVWSLLDNFEWTNGYTLKFGLYQVDFSSPNRTRTPKKSVEFIKELTRTRTIK